MRQLNLFIYHIFVPALALAFSVLGGNAANSAEFAVLPSVSITQPINDSTVSGTSVVIRAQVDPQGADAYDTPDFGINDSSFDLVAEEISPNLYELTFDSTRYENGTANIYVSVSFVGFDNQYFAEDSISVEINNSGPPIAFISPPTPAANATITGGTNATFEVEVAGLEVNYPPMFVSLSLIVNDVTTTISSQDRNGYFYTVPIGTYADGTVITISAESTGNDYRTAVITRNFTISDVDTVSRPNIPLSVGSATIYTAVCPSTTQGVQSIISALSGGNTSLTRAFTYDNTTSSYVEMPTQPTGGVVKTTGIFIATRVGLNYSLNGTATTLPTSLNDLSYGWTFAGLPLMKSQSGDLLTEVDWSNLKITRSGDPTTPLSEAALADAMGTVDSNDTETARPWFWNGSAYVQVNKLKVGEAYWFKNNITTEELTLEVLDQSVIDSSFVRAIRTAVIPTVRTAASTVTYRDQGQPPALPTSKPAEKSNGNSCGVGAGVASLLMLFLFLSLRLRSNRP
jgi:hypothetical protein